MFREIKDPKHLQHYSLLGSTVFCRLRNFEPSCEIYTFQWNLIHEQQLVQDLLKVVRIFVPRKLPVLSKQRLSGRFI